MLCKFDVCYSCYKFYGEMHCHKLEKLKLKDLAKKNSAYENGFICDTSMLQSCDIKICPFQYSYSSEMNSKLILYYDPISRFLLCRYCTEDYII